MRTFFFNSHENSHEKSTFMRTFMRILIGTFERILMRIVVRILTRIFVRILIILMTIPMRILIRTFVVVGNSREILKIVSHENIQILTTDFVSFSSSFSNKLLSFPAFSALHRCSRNVHVQHVNSNLLSSSLVALSNFLRQADSV